MQQLALHQPLLQQPLKLLLLYVVHISLLDVLPASERSLPWTLLHLLERHLLLQLLQLLLLLLLLLLSSSLLPLLSPNAFRIRDLGVPSRRRLPHFGLLPLLLPLLSLLLLLLLLLLPRRLNANRRTHTKTL